MVQRVNYAVFPNTRDEVLFAVLNKVFGHVHRSKLNWKAWREWLRDEDLWDKDLMPELMAMLDILGDKKTQVALGPWARRFFEADGQEAQQSVLYQRLLDENTLLVKYVFEALDMEGGGRLHSTYELHRMLTSYVYPGETIGLPNFQNWIKWMVLSGRVKLIGIRWGLTEVGKKTVPRLRMIDVDEFLEEEAEALESLAEEADGASDPAPAELTPPVATPTPAVAPPGPAAVAAPTQKPKSKSKSKSKLPKTAADEGDGGDEEMPDMPPEAPPVDDAVFAQYEADLVEAAPAEPEPSTEPRARTARRRTTRPQTLVRDAALEAGCLREPLDTSEIIEGLRKHGRSQGFAGGSLLHAFGLETRLAENEAARHLFLAALLARLHGQQPDGALADSLVDKVGALLPVAVLLDRPEALAEVIVRWGFGQPDVASTRIRGGLLDAVIGGRVLKAQADTPTILAEAASSEVLFGMLTQGVLRGAPPLAVFWLIREMVRVGLWKHEAATAIAFVPARACRVMAYRLRIIDSHYASTSARLIEVARSLARILPPGSVEAAAFEDLAPSDHLRFDCREVEICQQPCALAAPD